MPDRKTEYTDRIRVTLSAMHNKSMHEEIYRIMDSLESSGDVEALACLLNLTGKIYKMCNANYGLSKQVENLKRKTDRIWR